MIDQVCIDDIVYVYMQGYTWIYTYAINMQHIHIYIG